MLLLSSLPFAAVAYGVKGKGHLVQIDQMVYRNLLATAREASPIIQDLMLFGFFLMDNLSRPRPPEHMGLVITTPSSFPSRHTLGTMICNGFLAYLLIPKMPSPIWKWTLGLAILLLVLFEGLSRIFHGNHYLTNVLDGYLLGMAWLVLVCLLLENIFMWRGETNE